VSFRTYHQLEGQDHSQLPEQIAEWHRRLRDRMRGVRRVVAVMSGKGGVGKSYITTALALGVSESGRGAVGVLDADLKSPTVARLLRARGPLAVDEDGVRPAIGDAGIRVVSTDLLLDDEAPLRWRTGGAESHLWRGIRETNVLREFLSDVAWGELALLLVDLPPDSDRVGDLAELVPALAGAVGVTIPSEESGRSVARALERARELGVPLIGIVENMSGQRCATCGATVPLFEGEAGLALSEQFGTPLLARVPFVPRGRDADRRAALDPLVRAFLEALA
jgi:ATP-binding protein involved in chromosome partitioning